MFGLFGFDPKTLTDEELLDRISELARRMNWAQRMGRYEMVDQLRGQKLLCENEQRERLIGGRMRAILNGPPVVIETDPDLANEAKRVEAERAEAAAPKKGPARRPFAITKERVRRSNAPTSDDEG